VKLVVLIFISIFVTGCSVFGKSDVETAPYTLLESEKSLDIEVRNYDSIVLVSTSMAGDNGNNAFRKLFKYIGGEYDRTSFNGRQDRNTERDGDLYDRACFNK
jgi:hypothetical protein